MAKAPRVEAPQMELDFTVTLASPEFLAKGLTVPYTLYRADHGGNDRWYWCLETARYYFSVTTAIGGATPTPYGLMEWYKTMGRWADIDSMSAAAYGTFLHGQIGRLLRTGTFDFDELPGIAYFAARDAGYPMEASSWYHRSVQDILAFAAFMRKHNVEPVAIELMLKSDEWGYAGAADLVCRMDYEESGFYGEVYKSGPQKGQPKQTRRVNRITAIVDFKSGRKGFYESHELQLHMYQRAYDEQFIVGQPEDNPWPFVTHLFNWSPKDWRKEPDFNLKDQTVSRHAVKIPSIIEQFRLDAREPTPVLVARGKLTKGKKLSTVYAFETIKDRVEKL